MQSRVVIGSTILLVVLYIVLQPRSFVHANPVITDQTIKKFVENVQLSGKLDIDTFWQMRDQLGVILTYDEQNIEPYSILHLKKLNEAINLLVSYQGKEIISKEYLISNEKMAELQQENFPGRVVFQDETSLISFDDTQDKIYLRSILSFEEMKHHNGVIDYQVLEEDLSEKFWLIETEISISPNFSLEH